MEKTLKDTLTEIKEKGGMGAVAQALTGPLGRIAQEFSSGDRLSGQFSAFDQMDSKSAGLKGVEFLSQYLTKFSWPMAPDIGYRGMKHAKSADDGSIVEGMAMFGIKTKTASGINMEFEIPLVIRQGSLLEPSVMLVNGTPKIICQAEIDVLLNAATFMDTFDVRGGIYSPPLPGETRDALLEMREELGPIPHYNPGMFYIGQKEPLGDLEPGLSMIAQGSAGTWEDIIALPEEEDWTSPEGMVGAPTWEDITTPGELTQETADIMQPLITSGNATPEEIADKAKVSVPSVYRYWHSAADPLSGQLGGEADVREPPDIPPELFEGWTPPTSDSKVSVPEVSEVPTPEIEYPDPEPVTEVPDFVRDEIKGPVDVATPEPGEEGKGLPQPGLVSAPLPEPGGDVMQPSLGDAPDIEVLTGPPLIPPEPTEPIGWVDTYSLGKLRRGPSEDTSEPVVEAPETVMQPAAPVQPEPPAAPKAPRPRSKQPKAPKPYQPPAAPEAPEVEAPSEDLVFSGPGSDDFGFEEMTPMEYEMLPGPTPPPDPVLPSGTEVTSWGIEPAPLAPTEQALPEPTPVAAPNEFFGDEPVSTPSVPTIVVPGGTALEDWVPPESTVEHQSPPPPPGPGMPGFQGKKSYKGVGSMDPALSPFKNKGLATGTRIETVSDKSIRNRGGGSWRVPAGAAGMIIEDIFGDGTRFKVRIDRGGVGQYLHSELKKAAQSVSDLLSEVEQLAAGGAQHAAIIAHLIKRKASRQEIKQILDNAESLGIL